jgi:ATP-dependent Zn protease
MATTWDHKDMEKAAYHEAGHAIVAWSIGLVVRSIHRSI